MASRKSKKISIVFLLLIVVGTAGNNLFAQENVSESQDSASQAAAQSNAPQNDDDSYVKESEEGVVLVQKFSWEALDGALKYVFTIEQKFVEDRKNRRDKELLAKVNEDGYIPIDVIETESNFVELSLFAGTYRYKIQVYNFLGAAEYETQWYDVDIIKAYQPEVSSVSPDNIFLEEPQTGIFSVNGNDLRPGAVYQFKYGLSIIPALVVEQDERFRHVKLQVPVESLDSGTYKLYVTNPGGLFSTSQPVTIKFKKAMDFNMSVGYSPMWVMYDDTIAKYFGSNFYVLGANVRLTFIPIKKKFGYFGIGLAGFGTYLKNEQETYKVSSFFASAHIDISYQKSFAKNKLRFDAHVGAGISSFLHTQFKFAHDVKSEALWTMDICAAGGVSLQWYIIPRLYAEIGVDYVHPFMSDMMMGYLQPVVAIGYQL